MKKFLLFLIIPFIFIALKTVTFGASVDIVGGVLIYTADLGEENQLAVSLDDDYYLFEEISINISESHADCVGDGTDIVACENDNINSIEINLGDEENILWIESHEHEMSIFGGDDKDEIYLLLDNRDSEEDINFDGMGGANNLTITGDKYDDVLYITESGNNLRIERIDPTPEFKIDITNFDELNFKMGDGDDIVTFDYEIEDVDNIEDIKIIVDGEAGNDTIDASVIETDVMRDLYLQLFGGEGSDNIEGSLGDDIINCGDDIDIYDDNGGNDDVDESCDDKSATQAFPDIVGDKFQYYISNLYYLGIVNGFNDGLYHPEKEITRGEMAKMISRAFEIPTDTSCTPFPDVDSSNVFYGEIMTLKCKNIIKGFNDGTYRSGDPVTRGQASSYVVNTMMYKGVTVGNYGQYFPDVPDNNVFSGYINYLANQSVNNDKLVCGYTNGNYYPDRNLTRGEMAKIISNAREFWKVR